MDAERELWHVRRTVPPVALLLAQPVLHVGAAYPAARRRRVVLLGFGRHLVEGGVGGGGARPVRSAEALAVLEVQLHAARRAVDAVVQVEHDRRRHVERDDRADQLVVRVARELAELAGIHLRRGRRRARTRAPLRPPRSGHVQVHLE